MAARRGGLPGVEEAGMRPRAQTDALLDRRAAVTELGDELRLLLEAVVRTEVPTELLRQAAAQVREVTGPLSDRLRAPQQPASVDDLVTGVRMFNPVIGEGNPVAPPVRFEVDGDVIEGRFTLGTAHEGPHMFGHGGMSAMLLDQALGHAAAAAGNVGVTTNLSVRYRRPVPLGVPLRVWARVGELDGDRTLANGSITTVADPDIDLVTADARFLRLSMDRLRRMYPGLVGEAVHDPGEVHD